MSFTERRFRDALGRFPTGIAVITLQEDETRTLGMTINSFASLSLQPPLILWCLAKNSANCALYKESLFFGANILEESQEAISTQCASKNDHALNPKLIAQHLHKEKSATHAIPLLKDALVSFACVQHEVFDVGDHFIITGYVKHVHISEGEPLLFHRGAYGKTHA